MCLIRFDKLQKKKKWMEADASYNFQKLERKNKPKQNQIRKSQHIEEREVVQS